MDHFDDLSGLFGVVADGRDHAHKLIFSHGLAVTVLAKHVLELCHLRSQYSEIGCISDVYFCVAKPSFQTIGTVLVGRQNPEEELLGDDSCAERVEHTHDIHSVGEDLWGKDGRVSRELQSLVDYLGRELVDPNVGFQILHNVFFQDQALLVRV